MPRGREKRSGRSGRRAVIALAAGVALLVSAPFAFGHIERATYWPDPAGETVDGEQAGGEVPEVRPLFTALDSAPVGDTRVVCKTGDAIPYRANKEIGKRSDLEVSRKRVDRLKRKQKRARKSGFKAKAKRLKKKLTKAKKAYKKALNDEDAARQKGGADYQQALAEEIAAREAYQQTLAADPSMQALDASLADAVANGYELRPSQPNIQVTQQEADRLRDFNAQLLGACEYDSIQAAVDDSGNNDRVVIMPGIYTEPESRAAPTNDPACDAFEIPNDEGSVNALSYEYHVACPNDQNLVAVLGREVGPGADPPAQFERRGIPNLGPCIRCNLQMEGSGISPEDVVVDAGEVASGNGGPENPVKDVVIRADRADGFVLRNVNVRHAAEHGIYVIETDGFVTEQFKAFYNQEYGILTFTSDHALIQDCDTVGSGDSGIYPGAAPETGEQTTEPEERYNHEIRDCDTHHNASGYSGTASNGVWLHDVKLYDNALGFTTDVFTAPGHPGFPQDSDLIENNDFYSNNFNPYLPGSEVDPTVPLPVGVGMWIAGGNNNVVRNNRMWDNWRRGSMVYAVPNALVCPNSPDVATPGCDALAQSTSFRNKIHGNSMGRRPDGTPDPNGADFFWDRFPLNTGNCWFDNTGPDGTAVSLSNEAGVLPLPSSCQLSIGDGLAPLQEAELLTCFAEISGGPPGLCTWFTTPPEP